MKSDRWIRQINQRRQYSEEVEQCFSALHGILITIHMQPYLCRSIVLEVPTSRQFFIRVNKQVKERNEITVVLVPGQKILKFHVIINNNKKKIVMLSPLWNYALECRRGSDWGFKVTSRVWSSYIQGLKFLHPRFEVSLYSRFEDTSKVWSSYIQRLKFLNQRFEVPTSKVWSSYIQSLMFIYSRFEVPTSKVWSSYVQVLKFLHPRFEVTLKFEVPVFKVWSAYIQGLKLLYPQF